MFRQYIINTTQNLCMCPRMLTYCEFRIIERKYAMSLRAETGGKTMNRLSVALATGFVR